MGRLGHGIALTRNIMPFWVELGRMEDATMIQRAGEVLSSAQLIVLSDKVLGIQTIFYGSSHCFHRPGPKNGRVRLAKVIRSPTLTVCQ